MEGVGKMDQATHTSLLGKRFLILLTKPHRFFHSLEEQPAIIWIALIYALITGLVYGGMTWQTDTTSIVQSLPQFGGLDASQVTMLEQAAWFITMGISVFTGFFTPIVSILVFSLVVKGVLLVYRIWIPYRRLVEIGVFSYLPVFIGMGIQAVTAANLGLELGEMRNVTSLQLWVGESSVAGVNVVLSRLELFLLWSMALFGWGLSVREKLSIQKGLSVSFLAWMVITVIVLLFNL
jgi:hypothetical protein